MFYRIGYNFGSIIDEDNSPSEPDKFVNIIHFEINEIGESGETIGLVGKGKISQILFGLAMDLNYPIFQVMDASHAVLEISEVLFNWNEEADPWSKMDDYFGDPIMNYDICLLEKIEILPKYRKQRLTKIIFKNLIQLFYSTCGLWVIKAFPLQHDETIKSNSGEWFQRMGYDKFETDFEKSQYKLFHLYQSLGFVNPFDPDIFIGRPFDLIKKNNSTPHD